MVALCRLLPMNRKRENTSWYLFVFVGGLVTVIFGQTRSAVAGICVGLFLIYLLSSRVLQGAMIVISGVLITIISGFGDYLFVYLKRGQSSNQMESFSGRLEWWEVALEKFAMYPFTGLGMWAAARFGVLAKIGFTQTASRNRRPGPHPDPHAHGDVMVGPDHVHHQYAPRNGGPPACLRRPCGARSRFRPHVLHD
jgi:O-antigen ligase